MMSDKLDRLTKKLGTTYDKYKKFDLELNGKKGKSDQIGLKKEFFSEATTAQASTLAQKTTTVTATSWEKARDLVKRLNPTWVIKDEGLKIGGNSDDTYTFILEENPEFKPFTYVNKETKRVWTKQVVETAPSLDDEWLQEEDPELWKEITEIPNRDVIANVVYECGVDSHEVDDRLESLWEAYDGPRTLKSFEDLTPEQHAKVQKYLYPGPPQVKLQAPRDAKPEELDDE